MLKKVLALAAESGELLFGGFNVQSSLQLLHVVPASLSLGRDLRAQFEDLGFEPGDTLLQPVPLAGLGRH